MRRILGRILGVALRVWFWTLRVTVAFAPELGKVADKPWILCFFHGSQWLLMRFPRRRTTGVLVSLSKDGELQAGILSSLGFWVERGSSSRGGGAGLRALRRWVTGRAGDVAMAVDGPRGPVFRAKAGAAYLARASDAVLVPLGASALRERVLAKTWDQFRFCLPFSRVAIVVGAPVVGAESPDILARLAFEIAGCNARARVLVDERAWQASPEGL